MAQYLESGDYLIDVSLEGGSGKASVTSPAKISVSETGGVTVEIEWSSPSYDYMKVLDREYYPVGEGGNSRFLIELDRLYEELPVTAETVAMSAPHMIDYTIYFDVQSARKGGGFSQLFIAAGIFVLIITAAAAAVYKNIIKNRKDKVR